LLGGKIYSVVIGSGVVVRRFVHGEMAFEIAANPFGGGRAASHFPPERSSGWRRALMTLAGPMANGLCGALLLLLLGRLSDADASGLSLTVVAALAFAQIIAGAVSLYPHRTRNPDRLPSDGLKVWRILRGKEARAEVDKASVVLTAAALMRENRLEEARAYARSEWEKRGDSGALLGILLAIIGRLEGAQSAFRYYLDNGGRDAARAASDERGWAYADAGAAWQAVRVGKPDWVDMALEFSTHAVAAWPQEASVRTVREATLLRSTKGGCEALLRELRQIQSPEQKTEFCAFLADWASAQGYFSDAAEYRKLTTHLQGEADRRVVVTSARRVRLTVGEHLEESP
jgi:hypothetical protein